MRSVYSGLSNGVHQIEFIGDALYLVDTYYNRVWGPDRPDKPPKIPAAGRRGEK